MVVFSNHRLGAAAELLVSPEVASALLRETAAQAGPRAEGRWEHELVSWLGDRADCLPACLDVGDIAWSPAHFERERAFLVDAIERAATASMHARALRLWARQVRDHARAHVVIGRRWAWSAPRTVPA